MLEKRSTREPRQKQPPGNVSCLEIDHVHSPIDALLVGPPMHTLHCNFIVYVFGRTSVELRDALYETLIGQPALSHDLQW